MSKEYCEFNCKLQKRGEQIEEKISSMVNTLLAETLSENKDVNPACVRKLIGDFLKTEGDVIHIGLVEKYRTEKRPHQ